MWQRLQFSGLVARMEWGKIQPVGGWWPEPAGVQQAEWRVLGGDMANPATVARLCPPHRLQCPRAWGTTSPPRLTVNREVDFFARLFGLGRARAPQPAAGALLDAPARGLRCPPAGQLSGDEGRNSGCDCALIPAGPADSGMNRHFGV